MSSVSPPPLPVSLLTWKPMQRNSLRGFARIRLGRSLIISDVAIHCAHGRRWAQAPAKPQLDKDGNAKRDEKGKIAYVPVVEWTDREAADRFSEAVIAAVEREYPNQTTSEYVG
jgi:hypothetical protein